jgi:hypothetical protein
MKTMKYETPQLTALTPAIDAIQTTSAKCLCGVIETYDPASPLKELVGAYTDWE